MPFRYEIQLNGRTNVYEHKPLAEAVDRMAMRATLFGLTFAGKFGKLPNAFTDLVWEVLWMHLRADCSYHSCDQAFELNMVFVFFEVVTDHTIMRPLKPKFWLVGVLTVPAHSSVKLD